MFCAEISSRTVLRPFTPITIEPIPNATKITLAAIPPYPNHFFITVSFSFRRPLPEAHHRGPTKGSIGARAELRCGRLRMRLRTVRCEGG